MGLAQRLTTDMQRRIFGVAVDDLRKMVAETRNDLADIKVELNRLQTEVRDLREELERSRGGAKPIEEMSLDEVLALHKGCHDALERFNIHGGGKKTLRDAAKDAEAELDTIVATIKNLMKDAAA